MIDRLVRSIDFERVLGTRNRANSAHFAVHHLPDRPSCPPGLRGRDVVRKLSTGPQHLVNIPVDDSGCEAFSCGTDDGKASSLLASQAIWLGAVVPKRHARRSVTRNMLKRQIRAVVQRNAAMLEGGLWVVRLRAPFDRSRFVSAASTALRQAAREELDVLMRKAAHQSVAR